jgi:hypothetical protein
MSYEDKIYQEKLLKGYDDPYERVRKVDSAIFRMNNLPVNNRTITDQKEEFRVDN